MKFSNQEIGSKAERFIIEQLSGLGYKVTFKNTWYDLEAVKDDRKYLIEVKSTGLIINNGRGKRRYGRFDFTDRKNVIMQRKNNVIYVFVVYIGDSLEIMGCCKAISLNFRRYFSIHEVISKRRLKSIEKMF